MKITKLNSILTIACIGTLFTGLTGCGSTVSTTEKKKVVENWKIVTGVTVTPMSLGRHEVMKCKVDGRELVAVLRWRNYNAKLDGAVKKWYGDMATPPPKFVVESLSVSIDGRGLVIPKSKVRYLASQWMNTQTSLGLNQRGKQLRVLVDVGDGAEAWTASYVINPSSLTLISHTVKDGPTVHNGIVPE